MNRIKIMKSLIAVLLFLFFAHLLFFWHFLHSDIYVKSPSNPISAPQSSVVGYSTTMTVESSSDDISTSTTGESTSAETSSEQTSGQADNWIYAVQEKPFDQEQPWELLAFRDPDNLPDYVIDVTQLFPGLEIVNLSLPCSFPKMMLARCKPVLLFQCIDGVYPIPLNDTNYNQFGSVVKSAYTYLRKNPINKCRPKMIHEVLYQIIYFSLFDFWPLIWWLFLELFVYGTGCHTLFLLTLLYMALTETLRYFHNFAFPPIQLEESVEEIEENYGASLQWWIRLQIVKLLPHYHWSQYVSLVFSSTIIGFQNPNWFTMYFLQPAVWVILYMRYASKVSVQAYCLKINLELLYLEMVLTPDIPILRAEARRKFLVFRRKSMAIFPEIRVDANESMLNSMRVWINAKPINSETLLVEFQSWERQRVMDIRKILLQRCRLQVQRDPNVDIDEQLLLSGFPELALYSSTLISVLRHERRAYLSKTEAAGWRANAHHRLIAELVQVGVPQEEDGRVTRLIPHSPEFDEDHLQTTIGSICNLYFTVHKAEIQKAFNDIAAANQGINARRFDLVKVEDAVA